MAESFKPRPGSICFVWIRFGRYGFGWHRYNGWKLFQPLVVDYGDHGYWGVEFEREEALAEDAPD